MCRASACRNRSARAQTGGDCGGLCLALAKAGLVRRGLDEARYLDPLFAIVDKGRNRADDMLAAFKQPGFTMEKVFEADRLRAG